MDYSDYCIQSFMENSIGPKKVKDAFFTLKLGQCIICEIIENSNPAKTWLFTLKIL